MNSICRLCRNSNDLRQSHIIPEFLFHPLYDDKHRYLVLSVENTQGSFAQRGLTEKLLCQNCEQQLGRNEKYAAELMTGRRGQVFRNAGGKLKIEGLDYNKFKSFLNSILWRASVSSVDFFRLVSLGPREEILRQLILKDAPGDPEEFGCVVIHMLDKGQLLSDTMFNPEPMRWAGSRMFKFYFGGACWAFHCDKKPPIAQIKKFFLQKDGTMITMYGDFHEANLQFHDARRMARQNRFL